MDGSPYIKHSWNLNVSSNEVIEDGQSDIQRDTYFPPNSVEQSDVLQVGMVQNIEVIDASALVSALNFCSQTTSFVVGNQSGTVRIYKLSGTSCETSIHIVMKTKNKGGPRMFNSTQQDMILRRKSEEAELQQAFELQSRRLMGLQLLDNKKLHHHKRNMSSGSAPICSPPSPHMNHNLIVPLSFSPDHSSPDSLSPQEICGSLPSIIVEKNVMNDEKEEFPNSNNHDDSDFHNREIKGKKLFDLLQSCNFRAVAESVEDRKKFVLMMAREEIIDEDRDFSSGLLKACGVAGHTGCSKCKYLGYWSD
ncbi:hypothetical protein GIB67_032456 [Kingdonia uniflora]|uniref:Uncharacterized protein n=1 Tax=Kingdonia uniflora TaxID=39325 RepID=A0A7J7L7K7_9MAGN|nr:hypothetical protein GIB67_032456 [Kingdonia uniflora]